MPKNEEVHAESESDEDDDEDDDEVWDDVSPPPKDDEEEPDVEKNVEQQRKPRPSMAEMITRVDAALQMGITEEEIPIMGYLIASIVVFFAAVSGRPVKEPIDVFGALCSSGTLSMPRGPFAYAVCLGLFGALLSGILLGWIRYNNNRAGDNDEDGPQSKVLLEKNRRYVNLVLLIWALIGWGYFTFSKTGSFGSAGNGFFALWAMLLFALGNCGGTIELLFREIHKADSCVYALTLVSWILLIDVSVWLGSPYLGACYRGIVIYALFVAVLTIVYGCITAIFSMLTSNNVRFDPKVRFGCLLFLFVLWIFTACFTTFVGPFVQAGNGYFSAWAGLFLTGLAILDTKQEIVETYI